MQAGVGGLCYSWPIASASFSDAWLLSSDGEIVAAKFVGVREQGEAQHTQSVRLGTNLGT